MRITRPTIASLVLVLLLAATNLYLFQTLPTRADGLSHIYFLDVGQGDSILIRTADGENILVDGGPTDSIIDWLNRYLPVTDRTLDLVLLTHAHADHAVGLLSVIKQFPVEHFWYSGADYTSKIYNDLLAEVSSRQIDVNLTNAGDTFSLGHGEVDVIYPIAEHPSASDPNDTSVVAYLRLQDFDLLLTGDINVPAEHSMVAAGKIAQTEVLKVAHHGSRTSSSEEFLLSLHPDTAIISLGAGNTYGHPHQEVLQRLAAIGASIWQTDQHGTIQVITDGSSYKVTTSR